MQTIRSHKRILKYEIGRPHIQKTKIINNNNQIPASWQVSADGKRMIGHLILRRSIEEEDILGLKVTGGHPLPSGKIGAIIEKVKRGSIADREGHVKPGNPVRIQIKLNKTNKNPLTMRPANGHETIANHTFLINATKKKNDPSSLPPIDNNHHHHHHNNNNNNKQNQPTIF